MYIGRRIGNYVIQSELGQGGMGTVYLAQHAVIGRKAAIKILKREFASDEVTVGRFLNEARAAHLIGHPGIVDVLDVGTLPEGVPFLVMEYLQGESLARRLERVGRLGTKDALEIVGETASALGAAHAKGIVHRDLKPDNLFLVPDPKAPSGESVKVLDFGIAKLHGEVGPDNVSTVTGTVLGTPRYMSPEQSRGARHAVDHRTDIYALGIILYEMLCGVPPFVGEGFFDTMLLHTTQPPPPPRSKNPDVPPFLEQVILRALAKRPEERYSSMAELQRALGQRGGARAIEPPVPAPASQPVAVPVPPAEAALMAAPTETGPRGPGPSVGSTFAPVTVPPQRARTTDPRRAVALVLGVVALAGGVALYLQHRRGGPNPEGGGTPPAAAHAPAGPTVVPLAPPSAPPEASRREDDARERAKASEAVPTAPSTGPAPTAEPGARKPHPEGGGRKPGRKPKGGVKLW
jgi:serine/threonine-protein kinase